MKRKVHKRQGFLWVTLCGKKLTTLFGFQHAVLEDSKVTCSDCLNAIKKREVRTPSYKRTRKKKQANWKSKHRKLYYRAERILIDKHREEFNDIINKLNARYKT